MLSIYVAGASNELERVERWLNVIRGAPRMSLIHDWPQAIRFHDIGDVTWEQNAQDDQEAVFRADAFWLLRPGGRSTGAWVELGMALARLPIRSILISGKGAFNIFADHLPDSLGLNRYATDEEVWTALQWRAAQ